MKLQACDILLFRNDENDPISRLSRWAIGPYCHVAMYLGRFPIVIPGHTQDFILFIGEAYHVPLLYESRGRGVYIASLLPQAGMPVAVMRPMALAPELPVAVIESTMKRLLETAFQIAADEQSFYDYLSIVHSVLPRVIGEKLPWLPLPLKYHRDIFMICSEAVAEVFWRNDIQVIPDDLIPLPGDFALSPILQYVGQGKLMEDIVP